ncbi:MAG: pilus (MSHA type) biogenesis protein MshL [Halothiobacillaceae bacterium]
MTSQARLLNKHSLNPLRGSRKGGRRVSIALLAVAMGLAGCAQNPPRSVTTMGEVEREAYKRMTDRIAEESAKFRSVNDEIRASVEEKGPEPLEEAVEPEYDPLEDMVVTVRLHDAPLTAVLRVLAEETDTSLIVEPEVLDIDKRASLFLPDVTARELLDHVADAFDLAVERRGNVIRIGVYEDRLFNVDFLNTVMDLNLAAGGNVFGGGSSGDGGGADNLIQGDFSLRGGTAGSADPYEQLDLALQRILGQSKEEDEEEDTLTIRPGSAGYSINRASGTLEIRARPSQVKRVANLVGNLKEVMGRQVLIEAQLLDVSLNDDFRWGLDWNLLRDRVASTLGTAPATISGGSTGYTGDKGMWLPARDITFGGQDVGIAGADTSSFGIGFSSPAISVTVDALEAFGSVQILSNPSVRVRNHTPAILSVGQTNRYVSETRTTVSPSTTDSLVSTEVQTDSVFSGVIIGVMPSIDENGKVELLVHPMQSEVDRQSLVLQDVGQGNKVTLPQVAYKGITSMLSMRDGDVVVLGGLIDQQTADGSSGAPLIGKVFGNTSSRKRSRELVMVIRVQVL